MRLSTILILLSVAICCPAQRFRHRPDSVPAAQAMAHDPVMACELGQWHVFATGMGIDHLTSSDRRTWHYAAPVFPTPPEWAAAAVPGYRGHTWAPDIIFHRGLWHIFYSCSAFGKNTSAIGHATAPTLAGGQWTDRGCIVQSVPGRDDWNAIDPNVCIDGDGTPWMAFGSFWSGIKLVRLRPDMSAIAEPEQWHSIAKRDGGREAIEAPFIFKKGGKYYLFVSWDYCCRGAKSDYKVVVGRADNITGPYIDRDGRRMDKGGGTLVVGPDRRWHGIGHCAAYTVEGQDWFVCHGYSAADGGMAHLVVKKMGWTKDGWPVIEPN